MTIDTDIDLESIAHLDFDVDFDESIRCEGCSFQDRGIIISDNYDCPNPAKVAGVRSCCGMIENYCMDCYTQICKFYVRENFSARHKPTGVIESHKCVGKPFSQVHFL